MMKKLEGGKTAYLVTAAFNDEALRLFESDLAILRFLALNPGSTKYQLKKATGLVYSWLARRIPFLTGIGLVEKLERQTTPEGRTLQPFRLSFRGLVVFLATLNPDSEEDRKLVRQAVEKNTGVLPASILSLFEKHGEEAAKALIEACKMDGNTYVFKSHFEILPDLAAKPVSADLFRREAPLEARVREKPRVHRVFIPKEFFEAFWIDLDQLQEEAKRCLSRLEALTGYLNFAKDPSLRRNLRENPFEATLRTSTREEEKNRIREEILEKLRGLEEALEALSDPREMLQAMILYRLHVKPPRENPHIEALSLMAGGKYLVEVERDAFTQGD